MPNKMSFASFFNGAFGASSIPAIAILFASILCLAYCDGDDDLNSISIQELMQKSMAAQKGTFDTLNAEIKDLNQLLKVNHAVAQEQESAAELEGDPNAIHLSIRYPGMEAKAKKPVEKALNEGGAEKAEEKSKALKTPVIVVTQRRNFDDALEKLVQEEMERGTEANKEADAFKKMVATPAMKKKLLYERLKDAESHLAFYRSDENEMKYVINPKSGNLLGKMKARWKKFRKSESPGGKQQSSSLEEP